MCTYIFTITSLPPLSESENLDSPVYVLYVSDIGWVSDVCLRVQPWASGRRRWRGGTWPELPVATQTE